LRQYVSYYWIINTSDKITHNGCYSFYTVSFFFYPSADLKIVPAKGMNGLQNARFVRDGIFFQDSFNSEIYR